MRDVLEEGAASRPRRSTRSATTGAASAARARICKFFEDRLGIRLDRENDAIADRVSIEFPRQVARLRDVFERLRRLPGNRPAPAALVAPRPPSIAATGGSGRPSRPSRRSRQLDVLTDGIGRLVIYAAELDDKVIDQVRRADDGPVTSWPSSSGSASPAPRSPPPASASTRSSPASVHGVASTQSPPT
ncbi:MAG: hypothetical protein IPH44_33645 [Myxococcales bacterium]|nr:hypothetical protein [Myxococcales bacterium]